MSRRRQILPVSANTLLKLLPQKLPASKEIYHLGGLENVPLGLPQNYTTWVASELYHLGCLKIVTLGLHQKSTTWDASETSRLGCLKTVPRGLPQKMYLWGCLTFVIRLIPIGFLLFHFSIFHEEHLAFPA